MALVLSRKLNETVVIDDRMKITVIEVRGDRIKLAFDGPRSMRVERAEIVDDRREFQEGQHR